MLRSTRFKKVSVALMPAFSISLNISFVVDAPAILFPRGAYLLTKVSSNASASPAFSKLTKQAAWRAVAQSAR